MKEWENYSSGYNVCKEIADIFKKDNNLKKY